MKQNTPQPRTIEGIVTSDRMQKTRVVSVSRMKKHPKYLKYFKATSKFKVHDEANESHTGDRVMIRESRPLSKDKRWRLVSILERAKQTESEPTQTSQ